MAARQSENFFSSFNFKIIASMLLIAVVPVVASLVIFDRIASFNQDLQEQAVESIEEVSDIYKAWVKSESARIDLLKNNIEHGTKELIVRHNIDRVSDMRMNQAFKDDLKTLFDQYTLDESIASVRLSVNMLPIVKSNKLKDMRQRYKFQAAVIPIELRSRAGVVLPSEEPANDDSVPMLIASPIDDDNDENTFNSSLPEDVSKIGPGPVSQHGVQLVILFAVNQTRAEHYQELGEKKYLHGTVSAIEHQNETGMTSVYRIVFYTMAALVFLLVIISAIAITVPMSRRIQELSKATLKLADGDLNAKVNVSGNDQIAFLMNQFNSMVDEINLAQESKAYIERMQAWQEVARRLAHEIKNPLTPIVLAVQQLDKKFDDYTNNPNKYRKLLTNAVEIVTEETETLRKLVRDFSEFARMPIPEKKETKFYEFIESTVQQNPQFMEEAKRITIHPANEQIQSILVEIDNELMRRVIVNIVRNGIEASRNAHFEPEIDILVEAQQGDNKHKVCLRIIDNGPGLTDEQKAKLFMPYFTTKSDGTGLGLSIVRKIVEDHGGRISLHDRDDGNRGTQADIIL